MLAADCAHGGVAAGPRHDPLRDGRRDRRLAVGAEDQAGEGDADLAGGDVGVELAGVADERRQAQGQEVAVLGHLADPAAPDADRRELRRDVERRQDGEDDDDHERGQHVDRYRREAMALSSAMRSYGESAGSAACRTPEGPTRTSAIAARCPCAGVATIAGSAAALGVVQVLQQDGGGGGERERAGRPGRRQPAGGGGEDAGREPRLGRDAFDRRRAPADDEPRRRQAGQAERHRARRGVRRFGDDGTGGGVEGDRRRAEDPRPRQAHFGDAALDQRRLPGARADDRRARVGGGEAADERQAQLALPLHGGGAVRVGDDDGVGVDGGGDVGGRVDRDVGAEDRRRLPDVQRLAGGDRPGVVDEPDVADPPPGGERRGECGGQRSSPDNGDDHRWRYSSRPCRMRRNSRARSRSSPAAPAESAGPRRPGSSAPAPGS